MITFERHATGLGGPSFEHALMLTKVGLDMANEADQAATAEGSLTIAQAFMVLFCCAFGAGTAFQGWYPKLAGYYGYPLMILIVALSAGTASNALFETARWSGATSFAELCQYLPQWTGKVTPWCNIIWNFVVVAMYVGFLFSFINRQILHPMGRHFYDGQLDGVDTVDWGWQLYGLVGVMVFLVCLPTSFGGPVMKKITVFNAGVTWVVIITAIVKGFYTYSTLAPGKPEGGYQALRPEGFLQVIVLLSSAMFQVVPVPRLSFELKPESRERGSVILPFGLALLQGSVFCCVGIAGYLALGSDIPDNGDTFAAYFKDYNDWMVFVLQGGISVLMYLSCPMFSVVGKAELWGQFARKDDSGNPIPFEQASLLTQFMLNLITISICVLMPMSLGREKYMVIFQICAGTCTTWMNIFLPSIVIMWVQVLPLRRRGDRWIPGALKSIWLMVLGFLALSTAVTKIRTDILGF